MRRFSFGNRLKWIGIAFLIVFPFLFLGSIHLWVISVRMTIAYGLLLYFLCEHMLSVVVKRGSSGYSPTKGMKKYYVYLAVYIFVSLLNYSFFSSSFIKDLTAVHIVCCIALFVFPKIFKTEASIQGAFIVIAFGFFLNALTTILQAQNIPLGWALGMSINPTDIEELEELQSYNVDANELEKSIYMGIMGRSVGNGYFIATMLPVMTYHIWDKFRLNSLWTFVVMAITFICIYFIQQRMALIVVTIYIICVILLKKSSLLLKISIISIILFSVHYFQDSIMNYDYSQVGRITDFSDDTRSSTIAVLTDFISGPSNLLIGSNQITNEEERDTFLVIGHNTFTDTIRMGGIVLLIPFLILFYCLCKTLIKIFLFSRKVKDYRTMGMAMGCLCFLLYSQTHSTGVQSGSIMFWVLYMLCIQSHRVKCKQTSNGLEVIRWLQ